MTSRSANRGNPESQRDRIVVGRVVAAHGVRGEVKVEVLTDRPERFDPDRVVETTGRGATRTLTVTTSRRHQQLLIVRFAEIEDRDAASELKGTLLGVPREAVPPAPDDSYYYFELVGCACRDENEGLLGEVVGVIEDGGGELLRVARPGGGELLLPFVDEFLVRVATAERLIVWRLPEGLIEACG